MPWRRRGELLLPGVLEGDRAPGVQGGERDQILRDHFLFAAETAAHACTEHPELVRAQREQTGQFGLPDRRRLRTGADIQAAVLHPGDRAVRLKMRVLHPR